MFAFKNTLLNTEPTQYCCIGNDIFCVCLERKTFSIAFFLFIFSLLLFQNNREFGAKKIVQTIKKLIQFSYLFAMKGHFSGVFQKKIPQRLNLASEATCLFAYY